ncbi:oxidoreductase [Mesorhizobium caraganae]|uniref:acrylyl-CoA reductase (NADPH) n=1 Tax=Mesorhizobium caraganae TaxID=483206 RepID=UPI00193A549B|nr:MDR family oxidoreductase [Mesorhizobium caraganae]MBM2715008.1 oxidoreductase [Mesorhizobium caraganae]
MSFQAVVVRKHDQGHRVQQEQVEDSALPGGEVLVDITHSTINYKDGLAITGKAPVVRSFPLVVGIDFAGTVKESSSGNFKTGDAVVLNGWGVGETHWGGLAQRARVKSDWLIPLADGLTSWQAMAIGTAGYTAMLCVLALEEQGVAQGGEILVTGATGGVGSIAISLLSKRGFTVTASSGKPAQADYLKALGASEIIDRATLSSPGKPIAKERWAGVVDTVGGATLANACAATRYGGVVAACGMAQSLDFPGSVAPFILRGVTLAGVDSVYCPKPKRITAWQRLARELDLDHLNTIAKEIGLGEVIAAATDIIEGKLRGRVVVDVNR